MTNRPLENLSPGIQELYRAMQQADNAVLSEFWTEVERQDTPIIEPDSEGHSLVTFLWRARCE